MKPDENTGSCGCGGDDNICCGGPAPDVITYRPVRTAGEVDTLAGLIPVVATSWSISDYVGMVAVRLNMNRMNYAVQPGLYAVGKPDSNSPIIVSANYKFSFDVLRRECANLNVWILVIDSKGVNVWCAAGKGTFGTFEIINSIKLTGLGVVVLHRNIIVPQLGAPGVAAHDVAKGSGFKVIYGPVRASDLPAFINNGMKADAQMRRVLFDLKDRLAVAWLEFAMALKTTLILSVVFILARVFIPSARTTADLLLVSMWIAIITGTILTPALLPFLPGRAFSVKGAALGLAASLIPLNIFQLGNLPSLALMLAMSAFSGFLALNFTGASTYTSLSGVKLEMKYSIPTIIMAGGVSLVLAVVSVFVK